MTPAAIASPYCDTKIRTEADAGKREHIAAGLEALAAKIRTDKGMPVHNWGLRVLYGPRDGLAGIREAAAHLGIPVALSAHQYQAVLPFGPLVSYVLHAPALCPACDGEPDPGFKCRQCKRGMS